MFSAYHIEDNGNEITYKENQIKLRISFTSRAAEEIKTMNDTGNSRPRNIKTRLRDIY